MSAIKYSLIVKDKINESVAINLSTINIPTSQINTWTIHIQLILLSTHFSLSAL